MNWIKNYVGNLHIVHNGRYRGDCPLCGRVNTFRVTDTGFDSLAQRLEQLDNAFSQGNFNTLRDGTIDWSDPENITEFFNIVDGCTDYLRGIHVYNTLLREFGRKWVDFCKYDWGERLVEDYGVASNYSDYEED